MVAGYDAPIPDGFPVTQSSRIKLPSFHVWGQGDKLITPDQSEQLSELYIEPVSKVLLPELLQQPISGINRIVSDATASVKKANEK